MIPVKKINPRFATDTCSLIFMYQTGLLAPAATVYDFYITRLIYWELQKRADSIESETYQKSTFLLDIDEGYNDLYKVSNASGADNSLIALYHAINGAAILSEDGIVLKYCKKNNIPHFCCLSLVADMVGKNVLSRDEAIVYFNKLKKNGRYSDWVIETAYKMLENKKKGPG